MALIKGRYRKTILRDLYTDEHIFLLMRMKETEILGKLMVQRSIRTMVLSGQLQVEYMRFLWLPLRMFLANVDSSIGVLNCFATSLIVGLFLGAREQHISMWSHQSSRSLPVDGADRDKPSWI